MGIIGRVCCPNQFFGNGRAQEHREHLVVDGVCLVLIECQQNECVVAVEPLVLEQENQPVLKPCSSKVGVRIVSVVDHIWGDEHPLWELVCADVCGKVVKISDKGSTLGVQGDGVVENEGVVLAFVEVIRWSGRVEVVSWREAEAKISV